MADNDPASSKPANGAGQTHAQTTVIAEHAIENLVGIPISLREFFEERVSDVEETHNRDQASIFAVIKARDTELRRSLDDARALQDQEIIALRNVMDRLEDNLRREIGHSSELRTQELKSVSDQVETVRKLVDDRDIANKEAVTKAEVAATTAINAAAATTQTAVTKAETAATNAIVQAAEATKSAIDGVQQTLGKDIIHLREILDTYVSIHRDVHAALQLASDKFEEQSKVQGAALAEFQRASERGAENFVRRDALEEMRRGLEQSTSQRFEALIGAAERSEAAANSRFSTLEQRSQSGQGRETASNQYIGYMIGAFGFLLTMIGLAIAIVSVVTR